MGKRRQRHKESILQKKDGHCYLCMMGGDFGIRWTEEHHIFGGPRRRISEAEGLKVYLCPEHHRTGPAAVHRNAETRKKLQEIAQAQWEKDHSREEWMRMMGKNYREDEDEGT